MAKKKDKYSYEYPRPALTADVVLVTREASPKVLLIQRKHDPFAGMWAIPGGFVDENESAEQAARRELLEETGITITDIEQLFTSSAQGRDPRGWTVTVAYLARIMPNEVVANAGDDAAAVGWFSLEKPPEMAFDHAMILQRAWARIVDRRV
jgi:8-oxo-dGTP diphosphatase